MGMDERGGGRPKYGYGHGARPLFTARDRDAEVIRRVLRKAGCREFGGAEGGFAVEGGRGEAPFLVASTLAVRTEPQLSLYREVLTGAGMRVEPDPDDSKTLLVWVPKSAT
ncbi:hypothetical protein [Streptomyces sp. HD]|uniref:hypothetical protein n=1 Tax=Streptomyces sp. HD TaxID=3020892 RepID=UPI0023304C45|nr:hypothetical protein [Streptomyces sp. HD]MDC0773896.1 hypothetical protein [Streptomyces sp. HD]